jgi:hypothetical protein
MNLSLIFQQFVDSFRTRNKESFSPTIEPKTVEISNVDPVVVISPQLPDSSKEDISNNIDTIIETPIKKKINLILRGHVRNSFDDKRLYYLVKQMTEEFNTDIYIHTWNILQSGLSWRHINHIPTEVNEEFLKNYFDDLWYNVRYCMIEDDQKIELYGNTEGLVCRSSMPILAFKRMTYGQYRISQYLFENAPGDETVIQTRFDIMSNSFSTSPKTIMNLLHNPPQTTDRIKFIRNELFFGIDNTYTSSVSDLYSFLKFFYYNLDEIFKRHDTKHQEYLSFFERNNF